MKRPGAIQANANNALSWRIVVWFAPWRSQLRTNRSPCGRARLSQSSVLPATTRSPQTGAGLRLSGSCAETLRASPSTKALVLRARFAAFRTRCRSRGVKSSHSPRQVFHIGKLLRRPAPYRTRPQAHRPPWDGDRGGDGNRAESGYQPQTPNRPSAARCREAAARSGPRPLCPALADGSLSDPRNPNISHPEKSRH